MALFLGSTVGNAVVAPVTSNTGQILLGLAAGVTEFGPTHPTAMLTAADRLVNTQDGWVLAQKFQTFARLAGEPPRTGLRRLQANRWAGRLLQPTCGKSL